VHYLIITEADGDDSLTDYWHHQSHSIDLTLKDFHMMILSLVHFTYDFVVIMFSFPQCFAAEFAPLHSVPEGGIPLEHLISCISGVEISSSKGTFRKVQWAEKRKTVSGN